MRARDNPEAAPERADATAPGPGARALRRALCLLAVGAAAKAVLAALRAADAGAGPSGLASPWAIPAMLYLEVWAALAVLALDRGILAVGTWLERPVLADRSAWALYAGACAYAAVNVPVARQFSTPLTYAFLEAAGGALRDSITAYATPGNLLAVAAVAAAAVAAPRAIRPRRRGWAWAAAAAVVLALGPVAAARTPTLGLHRSALLTLAATTWARWRPAPAASGAPAEALPPEGPALDLSHLRGAARGMNVVWVILESTGARHLAAYGADPDPTPNLSRLTATALVFERMSTSDPESVKSLVPILCGQYPAVHTSGADYAAERLPCASLAATLGAAGYRTGLLHSGRFVYLGMRAVVEGRGFDELADAASIGGPHAVSFGTDDRSTARRVLEFVDAAGGRPFFALYMPVAGHHPYHAPGGGTRPFPARSEAEHHRNDLHVGDEALGELIAGISARGLMDRTLWIVMGDHGEAFFEHPGNFAHSLFVYEENVHIPVLIAVPGALRQQLRVPQVGGTIDLGPTLLELLGLPVPEAWAGRSLLRGEPGVARFFTDPSSVLLGLRQGDWKCIVEDGAARLFDLAADPGETVDVAAREPERAARCVRHLEAWSAEQAARVRGG